MSDLEIGDWRFSKMGRYWRLAIWRGFKNLPGFNQDLMGWVENESEFCALIENIGVGYHGLGEADIWGFALISYDNKG